MHRINIIDPTTYIVMDYRWPFYPFFGRPFLKRFALCYRTVVLSCLPVCLSLVLVYCGQMVGWIKMKLGTEVGVGPGRIVLDGDPAPLSKKGHSSPTFRPMSIVAKLLGESRCHLVWTKAIVLDEDPAPPPKKGTTPNFRPMSIVAKRSPISATAEHLYAM